MKTRSFLSILIDVLELAATPRTVMRRFADLQPESKTAFTRASEERNHRSGMKAGGITPSDKRDVGLGLMLVSRMIGFLDRHVSARLRLS